MNGRFLVLGVLMLAAFVPVSGASTDGCVKPSTLTWGACADAGGTKSGTGCSGDDGYASDFVGASVSGPDSQRSAWVSWSCYDWSFPGGNGSTPQRYSGESIDASYQSYHRGEWRGEEASWTAYRGAYGEESWEGCQTPVWIGHRHHDFGCPAGGPPAPVVVLP